MYPWIGFHKQTHCRPHVRRRALLACSALSRYEPDLLRRVTSKVLRRLRDQHSEVVDAALAVSLELVKVCSPRFRFAYLLIITQLHEPSRNAVKEAINALLQSSWPNHHERSVRWIILQILRTLRHVGYGTERNRSQLSKKTPQTASIKYRPGLANHSIDFQVF